jgi:hypothetical protein
MTTKDAILVGCAVAVSLTVVGGGLFWFLNSYTVTAGDAGIFIVKRQPEPKPCFVGMGYYLSGQVPECAKR